MESVDGELIPFEFLKALFLLAPLTGDPLDIAADKHQVPRPLVHAVAQVESGKKCAAKNGKYRGIMQVSPGAAREVGVRYPFKTCDDEIEAGVRYLALAIARGGPTCHGVSLYQSGLNKRPHCSSYGRKVMSISKQKGNE